MTVQSGDPPNRHGLAGCRGATLLVKPNATSALVALALALALPATAGASVRFKYGVAAGDVRSHSAILWGRAPGKATVALQLSRSGRFRPGKVKSYSVRARE